MARRRIAFFIVLLGLAVGTSAFQLPQCLMAAGRNLAKGNGNFYLYITISDEAVRFQKGDVLEYDVYLYADCPDPKGGIDVVTDGEKSLRDSGAGDDKGRRAHGDGDLSDAKGKWLHRKISLDALAGHTSREWNVQFEGDKPGLYVQFLKEVHVRHADGTVTADIARGGAPPLRRIQAREGYSRYFVLTRFDLPVLQDGADISGYVKRTLGDEAVRAKLADFHEEMALAGEIGRKTGDNALRTAAESAATDAVRLLETGGNIGPLVDELIAHHDGLLNSAHPKVKDYKGHLVGHGHIDFQWLWNWPETVEVSRSTFRQAAKFMDEFPRFHYSQSSSWLYRAVQDSDPALFAEIKKHVASGQWEIVGGRNNEADTNIISSESHARHFLYGQRYFRETFGKTAVVGWEPDTFGHTLQMPQLLKLAGLSYYYFCRAGAGFPLFWWEAPDGSRVLAFDDGSTGSWYGGDVTIGRFNQLFDFTKKTAQKEMLWVYGVGNHGGGPTRENIEAANGFAAKSYLPEVRFSTAQKFFEDVSKNDLTKLPTHKSDLNTVFEGCYTSHSDVKRWNRDAEAITESAEALAALAAQYGFAYPHKEFRRNWEDILWNHHHDTIGGTCIGSSYSESEKRYGRAIASSAGVGSHAMDYIAAGVKGQGVLAFNPVATRRRSIVTGDLNLLGGQALKSQPGKSVRFVDIPPVGYRLVKPVQSSAAAPIYNPKTHVFESTAYRVAVDPARGVVSSILDKRTGKEAVAPGGSINRLEVHWEQDAGMSAWNIGPVQRIQPLTDPVQIEVVENGPVLAKIAWIRHFQNSDILQTVSLGAVGPPEFSIDTQWNELGAGGKANPLLRVAFDVNATKPTQTYDVPFGTLRREADGKEYPALKWVDFADDKFGAAVINDCKHGYSAKGNTIWLSLIRSSFDPDPKPNIRRQHAEWQFLPHAGSWKDAGVIDAAQEFNHPVWIAAAHGNPNGRIPNSGSLVSLSGKGLFVTGVKLAEDGDDLVVRFYEAFGRTWLPRFQTLTRLLQVSEVNLVEDPMERLDPKGMLVRPFQIKTVKLKLSRR